jgi:mevalonate kinase
MNSVVVRIPFRLDLAMGGISDLPEWYQGGPGGAVGLAVMLGLESEDSFVSVGDCSTNQVAIEFTRGNKKISWNSGGSEAPPEALNLIFMSLASARGLNIDNVNRMDICNSFNGLSIELVTPSSKGLGSSTSTACAIVTAVKRWLGESITQADVIALSRIADRAVGSLAGWEDSIPALVGGAVCTRAGIGGAPLIVQRLEVPEDIEDQLLVFDTKLHAETGAILESALRHFRSAPSVVEKLTHHLLEELDSVSAELCAGDWSGLGASFERQMRAWAELTQGASLPPSLAGIIAALDGEILGAKPAGAGGGGMLLVLPKCGSHNQVRDILEQQGCAEISWCSHFEGMVQ